VISTGNDKCRLTCSDDFLLERRQLELPKTLLPFARHFLHTQENLDKSNYSELSIGGLVVLFLVREDDGKLTVFSAQVKRHVFVITM